MSITVQNLTEKSIDVRFHEFMALINPTDLELELRMQNLNREFINMAILPMFLPKEGE